LVVRRFTENDREGLRQIYLESRQDTFNWLTSSSLSLSDFDRDTTGEVIWVAEQEGSVVGFVSVDEDDNFIHNLFIAPKWMGHGFDSALLETCLQCIGRPARLKCVAENINALTFYLSRGWYKTGEGVSEDGKFYVLETFEHE